MDCPRIITIDNGKILTNEEFISEKLNQIAGKNLAFLMGKHTTVRGDFTLQFCLIMVQMTVHRS